jgi:hypothetical protein
MRLSGSEEKARAILESLGSAWLLPDGDQSARLISRAEDMPLLERIGTTDPYWMEAPAELLENFGMEWLKEQGGIVYPVRDAAGKQITYLRDKTRPGRAPWVKPDRRADAMPWTPPPGAVFYE